jgi:hypothetical protein
MAEETITCKTLRGFAHFVPGHGIVSGDPDAKDGKQANVPLSQLDLMVERGYVEKPKKVAADEAAAAKAAAKAEAEAEAAEKAADGDKDDAPPA